MPMYQTIVKLGDKKAFVLIDVENETYTFVTNMNDATFFNDDSRDSVSYYLNKIRLCYPNERFVSASIYREVLNEPIEHLITENKIVLD